MNEHDFIVNLAVALLAAAIGGLVARLLKLPVLVGYLAAGVLVGPHTPGVTANAEAVHAVAKLGVALLIFAIGVQFHLKEMLAIRKIALVGGGIQILGTIALGWLVGVWLGWGHYGGAFLGCALALSSTAVMMRLLEERGELGTSHATAMLGILVVQDLAVVLMMALLPAAAQISEGGAGALAGVGLSILRAIVLVAAALLLASRGVPWLLERAARAGSQELFLIIVVCVCLGAAYLAQLNGLSLELGAFLAGLVISESDYAQEVFSQIRPLRDLFASLFFVSIGMLLEPAIVAQHAPAVAAVVVTIVVGKSILAVGALFAAGTHGRTALLAGLGLAQIGEFSFVLASVGTDRKLIPDFEAGVILAAALISILLTPFVYGAAPAIYRAANRVPALARLMNRRQESGLGHGEEPEPIRAVILGCGRVGKHVSQALSSTGVRHVVVDYEAAVIKRLRGVGIPVVFGDATSEVVLREALTPGVELAVVALPEASMTPIAVRALKRLKPELPIIARVHRGTSIPRVRAAGADEVIHAEFEAATAIIRHGLARLGVPEAETEAHVSLIRAHRYRSD
ncbi:MAG: trkA [Armatimonadetes bacterium]|nr:trkA [Armatimonadota bacterium]